MSDFRTEQQFSTEDINKPEGALGLLGIQADLHAASVGAVVVAVEVVAVEGGTAVGAVAERKGTENGKGYIHT